MTSRGLEGWGRYDSVLGQCGTHESWFSHARALDTVLKYSQVAVGTAKYYELTSRVLEGWANVELMRVGLVMLGHWTEYLDIVSLPLVLHNILI